MDELKVFGEFVGFGLVCTLAGWLGIGLIKYFIATEQELELFVLFIIFICGMIAYNGIRNDILWRRERKQDLDNIKPNDTGRKIQGTECDR